MIPTWDDELQVTRLLLSLESCMSDNIQRASCGSLHRRAEPPPNSPYARIPHKQKRKFIGNTFGVALSLLFP